MDFMKTICPEGCDDNKHMAMLNAAAKLFLTRGFSNTSMDMIAAEAGVSKQTVYSHFQTKINLFARSIEVVAESFMGPNTWETHDDETVREGLTRVGHQFVRLLISPESIMMSRMLTVEGADTDKLAQTYYEKGPMLCKRAFEGMLKTWSDKGKLHVDDFEMAARRFLALLKGEVHLKFLLNIQKTITDDEVNTHVDEAVDAFLIIYGP